MNKAVLKISAAAAACTICFGSVGASAAGLVSYSVDGSAANAPMPGKVTASVAVDASQNGARLITAVYDDATGALANAAVSEKTYGGNAQVTFDLATLDGYSVKNFVWDAEDGITPLCEAQLQGLSLRADVSTGKSSLLWEPTVAGLGVASYTVYKNGEPIAENIPAKRASLRVESAKTTDVFRVAAFDANGTLVCVSNAASVDADEDTGVYLFDVEKIRQVSGSTPTAGKSYSGDETQIVAGGSGNLYYDAESDSYKFTENVGDGNWGVEEINGRKAMFTTGYYVGDDLRKGVINFLLGDSFTTDYRDVKLTFDYLDEGTDKFRILYVNGAATGNFDAKEITRGGTGEWKTATIELAGSYFNGAAGTGLYDNTADFRFESYGNMLHISNIKVERGEIFGGAEFVVADDNTVNGAGTASVRRYSDRRLVQWGSDSLKEYDEVTDGVKYYTEQSHDAAYMATEIGGEKALMVVKHKRASGIVSGNLYFELGSEFKTTEKSMRITLDYYDNSTDDFRILYSKAAGEKTSTLAAYGIRRGGTNTWKTTEINLPETYFNGGQSTGLGEGGAADFRIEVANTSPVYIKAIKVEPVDLVTKHNNYVIKSENADGLYPDGVSFTVGENGGNANGLNFFYNGNTAGDQHTVYETAEGSPALSSTSYGYGGSTGNNTGRGTYMYFDIDDSYMYGLYDDYALFEIEYLDCTTDNMAIQYNTKDNAYVTRTILTQTGTNEWKSARFELKDASFTGAQNYGSDFRLLVGTNAEKKGQLKIRSIKVMNVSHRNIRAASAAPRIFIAGDSIAANYTSDSAVIGWGMRLGGHLDGISVVNRALPGSSTKTFPNFDSIRNDLCKNDYVLISFGHNDSMGDARGVSVDVYRENMRNYIARVYDTGATPVVISSIPTYNNGVMDDEIDQYRAAAAEVAEEMHTAFIDLGGKMKAFLGTLSVDDALEYYVYENADRRVHLSETGAQKAAELVAERLSEAEQIRVLKGYIK